MKIRDEIAQANEKHWNKMVKEACGFTIPWLYLDLENLILFACGRLDPIPEPLNIITPATIVRDVKDKNVLCLACGGGQQSAVFCLLEARVTVVDLSQGQLEGDQKAARYFGYEVKTIHADMRDLSMLDDGSYDLVYGTGVCYIPDAREVYTEVARVIKHGGLYRNDWTQPAINFLIWNEDRYRITQPYCVKTYKRADGAIEFRHYMDDIFNGLLEQGFAIHQVHELSRDVQPDPHAQPGSWTYEDTYFGGHFVVVAEKRK